MILSAQRIRSISERSSKFIEPFNERTVFRGMSYGLSSCGYDVRIAQTQELESNGFALASTLERFEFPNHLMGRVCDKSTWARLGLTVQNTIIEPGWCGYLTLELMNHSKLSISILARTPIAQIIFEELDQPTEQPYSGKYQDQLNAPVGPIYEK